MNISNVILNNIKESVQPIKESTYNNVYDYVKANGGDMDVPDNTVDGVVCVVTPDSQNSWYDKAVVSAYKRVPMLDNGCADWYKFVKRYYNSFFKDEFYGSPEDIIEDDTLNNMFAGGCSEEFYKRMEIALTGTSIDDEVEGMNESEDLGEHDNYDGYEEGKLKANKYKGRTKNEISESTSVTAKVTYHNEDGTRDYIAGKLSDGRYFLIGQQERIVVSDKDLPKLAKRNMNNFSYEDDGDEEFLDALDKGTTLDNDSSLAKIIINASRKYLDDGCYLLSESTSVEKLQIIL